MGMTFESLYAFIRLSPARRIAIYERLLVLGAVIGFTRLVTYAARALSHDRTTLARQQARRARRNKLYAVPVQPIDIKADTLLSGFRSLAVGLAAGLRADHPISIAVSELLKGIFPNGVGAITSLQYVEQVAAMEDILMKLHTIYAPQVAFLGLKGKVELIAEVTKEYRDAVSTGRHTDDSAEIRAADERGHVYLMETVGIIVGEFYDSDNPEHVATREKLLAPVYEQMEEVREKRRAGRNRDDGMGSDEPQDMDEPGQEPGDDAMAAAAAEQ